MSDRDACAGCSVPEASKLCLGCSKVYYCSKECQRKDWICHIFACNPRRPINTADHLALAVRKRKLPEHPETRVDWGFEKAIAHHTAADVDALLELYIELIDGFGLKPLQMHKWRKGGTLLIQIKMTYDSFGPDLTHGRYSPSYQWLMAHEDVLAIPKVHQDMVEELFDLLRRRMWLQLGHPQSASTAEVNSYIESLPKARKACFEFFAFCLEDMYPPSPSPQYLNFGFGACHGPQKRAVLGRAYHDLTLAASFEEFYEAYNSGKLFELFAAKNVALALDEIELEGLADILGGMPSTSKTVWQLEQFIAGSDKPMGPIPEKAWIDYGYERVEDDDVGQHKLSLLYVTFFASSKARPLALHKACMERRLLEFFEEDMGMDFGKERKLYKRLLRPCSKTHRRS